MDSFIEAGGPLIIPLIIKSQQPPVDQLLGIEKTHFLKPRSYIDNIILYPSDMAHKLLRYIYIKYHKPQPILTNLAKKNMVNPS
jgi:hypothetical protein